MERGAFMHKSEVRQNDKNAKSMAALGLGVLLAFGVELMILLLGSVLVSAGILRPDSGMQVSAAACLIGCFAGGCFACGKWREARLLCGLLCGLLCFVVILLVALISTGSMKFGGEGLIELAACLIGGGLAGASARKKKSKKRKIR